MLQMTEFQMYAILPIVSYSSAYRPKATPFAGEACETKHLVARMESCWKEDSRNSSVTLFTAISQVSTRYLCGSGRCVGVHLAMALIDDARQAMSEGKSGPVETTALL